MVTLTGLERRSERHAELFDNHEQDVRHEKIMTAMDKINMKYGGGTLRLESSAFNDNTTDRDFAPWEMKRAFLSPAYTTRLRDIPVVQ
jgi:DNA polymerase V